MKGLLLFAMLFFAGAVYSQDIGVISPDTLIPQRTVVVPATLDGLYWERTYSGDSVSKFNDLYILKMWIKRAGNPVAFDSSFVSFRIKTRGIDTLNQRRGFIWRNNFQLLPR